MLLFSLALTVDTYNTVRISITLESSDIGYRFVPRLPRAITPILCTQAGPMSAKDGHQTPDTDVSPPTLTDRVRDLAVGRRSLPSLRGTNSRALGSSASLSLTPATRLNTSHGQAIETEQKFRDRFLDDLHNARALSDKIAVVKAASVEIQFRSMETVSAILAAAEDFTQEGAPLEARKAGFNLLTASASHSGLDNNDRSKLMTMITIPFLAADSSPQILALRQLTDSGRNLAPLDRSLPPYLNRRIEEVFEDTTIARTTLKKQKPRRSAQPVGEELSLGNLLSLLRDIVCNSPKAFEDDQLVLLVRNLVKISKKTTVDLDLRAVVEIFRAITEFSRIPSSTLESCIEVLCATSYVAKSINTWPCFQNLLRSGDQAETIDILLNFLLEPSELSDNVIRGVVATLNNVISSNGENGLPLVPLSTLAYSLRAVSLIRSKLEPECLQIIGSLVKRSGYVDRLLKENWTFLHDILDEVFETRRMQAAKDDQILPSKVTSTSPLHKLISSIPTNIEKVSGQMAKDLQEITSILASLWNTLDLQQRQFLVKLLLNLGLYVDIPDLGLAIDYMVAERLIFPTDENWDSHISMLIDVILLDTTKTSLIRCQVIYALKDVRASLRKSEVDILHDKDLILHVLQYMKNEEDLAIANSLADYSTDYAQDADNEVFETILNTLKRLLALQDAPSAMRQNQIISCLVRLFLQCLPHSAYKTVRIYRILVTTASNKNMSTDTRLMAMKLLTRLRCDSKNAVKVVPFPDSQSLAVTLCRTEASAYPQPNFNRMSNDDPHAVRVGRSNAIDQSNLGRSRSTTRSGNAADRVAKPTPPLWMYPGSKALPEDPPPDVSQVVHANVTQNKEDMGLEMDLWLDAMLDMIENEDDWEIYSYILVHLPSQLSNLQLFMDAVPYLSKLQDWVLSVLGRGNFREPPASTGVKKGDVALCIFQTLTILIGYRENFGRSRMDKTVHMFLEGISKWDRATRCCIHGLAICCYEIPNSISTYLPHIISKMSKVITQSHLAVDILEFLGGLARLPHACRNLADENLRAVFGICISYIDYSREQRQKPIGGSGSRANVTSPRYSGISGELKAASETGHTAEVHKDLPEYVFALAYHVMTIWFLSIDIRERSKHVGWIAKRLVWKDDFGNETMEEQSQVTLDMMHRTAYLDLGETTLGPIFSGEDGSILKQTWLVGMSIVTLETAIASGLTRLTKRQASGTTHARYQQCTAPTPPHHVPTQNLGQSTESILPSHVLLQLGSTIAPMPIPMQPIVLPDDESTKRAIGAFDRNDTVDGYKVGVIYIGNAQKLEIEILANISGTESYNRFLSGLGTRVCLKNAIFNTQGLDRESDQDGTHTFAWRDRVTEIVFHVPTMMPTDLVNDSQCTNKKRHIGNEFVKIIYNDSGLSFNFDTFDSQFNYVNIIITPEPLGLPQETMRTDIDPNEPIRRRIESQLQDMGERQFFRVETQCASSLPPISPAATPKIISASALPAFVRQIALNASVFSLAWSNRDGDEHVSSWRNRLKEIIKLRNRYGNTATSQTVAYPGMSTEDRGGARSYVEGDQWRGTLALGGMAEEDKLLLSLDFTRWT